MADNQSFFRRVVRFVANPATDWSELSSKAPELKDLESEKSELKAMIERKRRNDFVRRREFDMLRRVRREGLTPEQLAALGGSSRLDDSEARLPGDPGAAAGPGVKAKIDAIEQQMVGDGLASVRGRVAPAAARAAGSPPTSRAPVAPPASPSGGAAPAGPPAGRPQAAAAERPRGLPPAPLQMGRGLPPLSKSGDLPVALPVLPPAPPPASAALPVEVHEVIHDPELDEAVIAFANADFAQSEAALRQVMRAGSPRSRHAETWLVLFDLYRATGQDAPFEALAMDYARQFGWSAPQWYSLPQLVADAPVDETVTQRLPAPPAGSPVGWVAPTHLDLDSVARLRSQTLQMPLPWVFDWSVLERLDADAAMQLSTLFRLWAGQALEMRWVGGKRLFSVLADSAPTGVRDADPAFWLTRLDALRLANRADAFDEAAIDYCVTYEVSPPAWEPARCKVHISDAGVATRSPSLSRISEVSTTFRETQDTTEAGGVEVAHLELSGQLVGDISGTLDRLNEQLDAAPEVVVSCARLIRVDFIAAGDLLNWVLAKRKDGRRITFQDAHRLVALFFGAMGINEHAVVQLRRV
jgi:hypothetical protein